MYMQLSISKNLFKISLSTLATCLLLFGSISMNAQDFAYSKKRKMERQKTLYGIEGQQAPQLSETIEWIDQNGKETSAQKITEGKFTVIYGFQSWCPGCHSRGLPALKKMSEALKDSDKVDFMAIQTVFEGSHTNNKDKLLVTQEKYDLNIPFGHDAGNNASGNRSITMNAYRTGGTPWFIFIDASGKVVFNDYHINVDAAIEYLEKL